MVTKKTTSKKLNVKEYLELHPLIKEKINELSYDYIKSIHKIMEENSDVQAIVKISFELTR